MRYKVWLYSLTGSRKMLHVTYSKPDAALAFAVAQSMAVAMKASISLTISERVGLLEEMISQKDFTQGAPVSQRKLKLALDRK